MKTIKLYCLPCAGGTIGMYRGWKRNLNDNIDVCPIELAGRGNRFSEPLYNNFDEAIEDVCRMVSIGQDTTYALFGHSMGSILSYELARRIKMQSLPSPKHIFFSSSYSPETRSKRFYNEMSREQILDETFKMGGTAREVIENKELMDLFLPIIRSDFHVLKTYQRVQAYGDLLDCPISIMYGEHDPDIDTDEIALWKNYTSNTCEFQVYNGGHFYINENKDKVLNYIESKLI